MEVCKAVQKVERILEDNNNNNNNERVRGKEKELKNESSKKKKNVCILRLQGEFIEIEM